MPFAPWLSRCEQPSICLKNRKKISIIHLCKYSSAMISAGTSSKLVAILRMPSLLGPVDAPLYLPRLVCGEHFTQTKRLRLGPQFADNLFESFRIKDARGFTQ